MFSRGLRILLCREFLLFDPRRTHVPDRSDRRRPYLPDRNFLLRLAGVETIPAREFDRIQRNIVLDTVREGFKATGNYFRFLGASRLRYKNAIQGSILPVYEEATEFVD